MSSDYLGEGGRLAGGPAPELIAAGFAAETQHGPALHHAMSASDLAHAVVLVESGSIDASTGRELLRGLLELDAIPGDAFPWTPQLGDAFNSREHELRRRVGAAAAGWLSAGRPRREAFRVALRLVAREGALRLHGHLVDRVAALASLAARHASDLTADYTYLLPAQPTTLGHLFLSYAMPTQRDARRVRDVHGELSASVAGAGGGAGSRWPISRERLAELLGCTSVVAHTRDAAWQADAYAELAAANAIQATHASQLAQDLEILASMEFGVVTLADGHSRASALMPQKRNPYALPVIRAAAATAAGDLTAVLTALHTGSARTDHFQVLNGVIPRMLAEANAAAALATAVVGGLAIDLPAAERAAREGFVTAADVADVLAIEAGLDYRSAHTVIGRVARDAHELGRAPQSLTAADIADAGEATLGRRVEIADASLVEALDPAACVASRRQSGSAKGEEVAAMLDALAASVADERMWSASVAADASAALDTLRKRAAALARELVKNP